MDDDIDQNLATLRALLDEGIVELDEGRGVEMTPVEFIAEVLREASLET